MDKIQILDLLDKVAIYYPHANEVTEDTLNAWHVILDECDAELVNQRLIAHVKNGNRFAPSPGELFIKKDPYDPLYDYELTKKYLAEFDEINKTAERMTPQQKENVANAQREIEQLLNIKPIKPRTDV